MKKLIKVVSNFLGIKAVPVMLSSKMDHDVAVRKAEIPVVLQSEVTKVRETHLSFGASTNAISVTYGRAVNAQYVCAFEPAKTRRRLSRQAKADFIFILAHCLSTGITTHQCHCGDEPSDYLGNWYVRIHDGSIQMIFELSAVMKAYRNGGILLLEHAECLNKENIPWLKLMIKREPIRLLSGEEITPNPKFRLLITSQVDPVSFFGSLNLQASRIKMDS